MSTVPNPGGSSRRSSSDWGHTVDDEAPFFVGLKTVGSNIGEIRN